jgi:hypothetical protein
MANSYGFSGVKQTAGNAQSATSAAYTAINASAIDLGAAPPSEVLVQMEAFAASVAGTANSLINLYLVASNDNSVFSETPSATTLANAVLVGSLSQPTTGDTATHTSPIFPLSPLFGGALPRYLKFYTYNGWGQTLAATGCLVTYQTETFG